jgi:outer membrane protein
MRKWKWYPGLPVIVLVLAVGIEARSQSTPVTIKSAIDLALSNNYSLKSDSMNILSAGYQVNVLKSSLLPQVNYNNKVEYNPAIASQMVPGSMVGQPGKESVPVQFGTRYSMGGGVEVTHHLFRKDLRLQIGATSLNTGIAKTKYQLTREELVYQVALSFYSLQSNAELIRTTTHDYVNMTEILAIAKAQFESGVLKKIDYESLQINTTNKQSYLNQLQTQYNDQLAYFNYLLGIPAATQTIIDDRLPGVGNTIDPDKGIAERADIRLSNQLIVQKEVEIKSIRAERLPVVSSYFRFNYQAQFNKLDAINNTDYWFKNSTVGITTSIPLFDGHRRKNKLSVAKTELQQLKFKGEQQQQLAKTEQVRAWGTFANDNRQYRITKENLALAERVFTSRKALYAEGVTSLIELLDAEKELSQSRNLHIGAMIDLQTSMINIHKANGTLLADFINTL